MHELQLQKEKTTTTTTTKKKLMWRKRRQKLQKLSVFEMAIVGTTGLVSVLERADQHRGPFRASGISDPTPPGQDCCLGLNCEMAFLLTSQTKRRSFYKLAQLWLAAQVLTETNYQRLLQGTMLHKTAHLRGQWQGCGSCDNLTESQVIWTRGWGPWVLPSSEKGGLTAKAIIQRCCHIIWR